MSLQAPLRTITAKSIETPVSQVPAFKGAGCDFFLLVHSKKRGTGVTGWWVFSECGGHGRLNILYWPPSHWDQRQRTPHALLPWATETAELLYSARLCGCKQSLPAPNSCSPRTPHMKLLPASGPAVASHVLTEPWLTQLPSWYTEREECVSWVSLSLRGIFFKL